MIPLPKGAIAVDDVPPLPQGAVLQPETAYDRFLTSLRNPQTGGRSGVFGPAMVGGTGELIKECQRIKHTYYHFDHAYYFKEQKSVSSLS
jgi:hypothetical protein